MEHEILYQPSFALLRLRLAAGEVVNAEAGAMVSMSSGIEVQTEMVGGVLGALKRSILGGESLFMNTFTAREPAEITFAPPLPGDIVALEVRDETWYAQSGAYIASAPTLQVDTRWGGARTFFSREGLFLLKVTGAGPLFLSSYGAIHRVELSAGQRYTIDTGHLVAFTEGVRFDVRRFGGLRSTLLGGEGLVCEYTGPGAVLLQTRSTDSFLDWLIPRLPLKGQNSG